MAAEGRPFKLRLSFEDRFDSKPVGDDDKNEYDFDIVLVWEY